MQFFVSVLLVSLVSAQDAKYTFETKYIEIPLDHFTYRQNTTFKLRYLVNDTFFGPNETIFFYTGNKGDIEMFAQNTGFIFERAPEFNALIIFAEHRYYGESLPFGNVSYTSPEYLGYLGTSQALADFVYLINELQKIYTTTINIKKLPVVAIGGSYGGELSAWLKMKYPNSVIGALASSAPIWSYKGQNPCGAYYKIVTEDFLRFGSEKCENAIRRSWEIIRGLANSTTENSQILHRWNFCKPIESDEDINLVVNWLTDIYSKLAETNYPYPTNFVVPLPANPIKEFCKNIDARSVDEELELVMALNKAIQIYTNYTGTTECNDLETLENIPWGFQECTEMIAPLCSEDSDMFESYEYDFSIFSDDCYKRFGIRPKSQEVPILEYGDKDLSTAKNIIFSNGLLDPWSAYGILTNITEDIVAIVMPDGAHQSDLRASHEEDPESVKIARFIEIDHIRKWVDNFYNNSNADK